MESDWKRFRALVPLVRERYLAKCNLRIARMLNASGRNETERFWDAMEEMEKAAKTLRRCLDGHSRSKMFLFMISMVGCGMLTKDDLTEFSQELQDQIAGTFGANLIQFPTAR